MPAKRPKARRAASRTTRDRDLDDGADVEPLLGALVRLTHQSMTQEVGRWLVGSDFADLQPTHCAAIQPLWASPDGLRLTELARAGRITKQSMSALVDHLERTGYVERVADPHDQLASRIRLTARGRAFGREVRALSDRVEASFAELIGEARMKELRDTLALLHEGLARRAAAERI
jgi:DNA-binding MarR family transcriptional regulator